MFQSCKSCPSYNNGNGSKQCHTCNEYGNQLPFERPHVPYLSLPSEVVENLVESVPKQFLEHVLLLDEEEGTMLCQSIFLGMSHKDVGEYHGCSKAKVQRIVSRAIGNLRRLIKDAI